MKLAIIGDLHYPQQLTDLDQTVAEARDAFFERFIDLFLAIDADYHISIGDLTHAGEFAEFEYIINKVESSSPRRRFLHVLGNHDTYTHPKTDIIALTGQQRYGIIEDSDAIILLLDTAREIREDWSGTIDEEQLVWLKSQLNRETDKPLLVFGHHPLHGTTARSTEEMMSMDPELDIWPILANWPGIGFYFNGHNHIHSIVRKERWHFIQTAAIPDVPAVRIVTVNDNEVNVETVSLANDEITNWTSVFAGSLYDYEPFPNAEGDADAIQLTVIRPHTVGKRVAQK
ncbi:metallophosphoesterase family protein [Cohnella silvisoli]|uniref:Metallophosphoesterase n=1 Tax=Cohnella silvisoli TaxID=2873699 RepID=A0ABV1KNL1_9BACL|nr:metallophosphoesterase [Cohnella silvisoli]MCD9021036.1 metallophosphoesterase [Cohnella silvisoli]